MAETKPCVLVTGANGCIGAWVLKGALARGWLPVAFDLAPEPTRPRLILSDDELAGIPWIAGDIVDAEAVARVFDEHRIDAVVHLGALQVPFCAADPVAGAEVNVVGTVVMFEAVRRLGIKRFAFASSVGIHGKPTEGNPYLATLYGAYKSCTEEVAGVYWQDWQVPSICLRPGIVYGVGRDQGMTSAPTKAILAAAIGRSYTIPFSGELPFLYVREVAGAFLAAVAEDREGAQNPRPERADGDDGALPRPRARGIPRRRHRARRRPVPVPRKPVGRAGPGAARRLRRDGAGGRRARDGRRCSAR